MPEEKAPPQPPFVDLESSDLKMALDQLTEGFALELVNSTFRQYENFRSQNHDSRWRTGDSLYFGWVPQRTWEGTTVPRASLSRPIVFEQVETVVPVVYNAIFSTPDWFQVEPDIGASPEHARQVQEALTYILEHPKEEIYSNFRTELDLVIRDMVLYGNGGISLEWDFKEKRPKVFWVSIKDIYLDPGLSTPMVDESRSLIHRRMMTVQELAELRGTDERLKIPEDAVLYHLAKNTPTAVADQTKAVQEALRGVSYQPNASDVLPNPSDRRVEVLVYYSRDRIIWVLGRQWVAFNEPNPYGFIPFCFAPCFPVPGRFYARSIADIQHWNQRYIEALLNARLDELTLALQPPRIQPRDAVLTPGQQRWRPGAVFTSANPADFRLLQPQSLMNNVYTEISYIEQAGEKATGINALAQGAPRSGNIHRTAAGVHALSGAAVSRVGQIVANLENYLIVPMLYKLYQLVRLNTETWDNLPARNSQGAMYAVPALIFRQKMKFKMLASSRVLTREKLAGIFPFLLQYLLNGQLLGQLQQTGQTVDIPEIFRMLQDATGVSSLYRVVRPMTPQEQQLFQQQAQQAQQNPAAILLQQKQAELQLKREIAEKNNQTQLQIAMINKQPDPGAAQREQLRLQTEAFLSRLKTQAAAQEAQVKMAAKQQDLEIQRQKAALKMQELLQGLRFSVARRQQQAAAQDFEQALGRKVGRPVQKSKE